MIGGTIRDAELRSEQAQQRAVATEQRRELGGTDAAAQRCVVVRRVLERRERFDIFDHQLPAFAAHGLAGRLKPVLEEMLHERAVFVVSLIDAQLHLATVRIDQLHAATGGARECAGKRGDLAQRGARVRLRRQADLQRMQLAHALQLVAQRHLSRTVARRDSSL
ncbi:hypothetical protein OZ10_15035 [Xanthomonas cannabis pv. cannabis]|nr:hypothetical protein OZ10_15035 [Xanthomonas cannabis pv. cannabis]